QVTGLGTLATKNSVTTAQVTGLGTLATKNSVTTAQVTGLGSLATMSSVSNSYITSIDGGKISTGTIALNSGSTSVRINNAGKISFYPSSTEAGYITTGSSNTMELNSSGRILIESASIIQVNGRNSINLSGTLFYVGSNSTFNGNITISGTRTLTGSSTSVSVSSISASNTITAKGNVFAAGLVIGSYGMEVSRGQPKRLTTRSAATSYIDFDYSGGYIKIAANGGTMVNAVAYSSDVRLKENIIPLEIDDVAQKIYGLNGYKYNLKTNPTTEIGLIAQDLLNTFPELVSKNTEDYYAINYHMLSVLLLETVKQLNRRVEILEAAWT
ncbi:MAG: tail fiber domain-containing protein, partial [Clostridia bacterium]|nr:tail fiber domain-containing protein [Clostridia bacterium]